MLFPNRVQTVIWRDPKGIEDQTGDTRRTLDVRTRVWLWMWLIKIIIN